MTEMKTRIRGVQVHMQHFEFIFGLVLGRNLPHLKPGVHTNDFATIHGRPVRIHTAPAEDNTSNQQSTPQALCEYGRGDRES